MDPIRLELARGQRLNTEIKTFAPKIERQRLAIARALLQDPLVLILDEATSAVDRDTEARLVGAVDTLFAGRTRIVISHRAEALAGADRVFEIADGAFRPAAVAQIAAGGTDHG